MWLCPHDQIEADFPAAKQRSVGPSWLGDTWGSCQVITIRFLRWKVNPATWITYRCNRVKTKRNAVVAVTHICVGDLTIIGADNGLSPGRRQAIIWTNDGILLIGPLGTNFSEILIEICIFYFKKMHLKVSPAKWRPFCLWPQCVKEEENGEENGEVKEVDNDDGFEKFHSADCDIRWLGRSQ